MQFVSFLTFTSNALLLDCVLKFGSKHILPFIVWTLFSVEHAFLCQIGLCMGKEQIKHKWNGVSFRSQHSETSTKVILILIKIFIGSTLIYFLIFTFQNWKISKNLQLVPLRVLLCSYKCFNQRDPEIFGISQEQNRQDAPSVPCWLPISSAQSAHAYHHAMQCPGFLLSKGRQLLSKEDKSITEILI